MERKISAIIRKFSILLGINNQEKCGSGLATTDFSLSSLVRSLGLRHGGGSSMAGSHVISTSRVSSAMAGVAPAPVYRVTGKCVPHCWRPARMAWRDSGKFTV